MIKYGLEFECAVNTEALRQSRVIIGGYHAGKKCGKYWKAERDGSVQSYIQSNGERNTTVEFVSVPFTLAQLPQVMEELRTIIGENANAKTFTTLEINNSMGAHIHFSDWEKIPKEKVGGMIHPYEKHGRSYYRILHLYRQVPIEFFKKFRSRVFREMTKAFPLSIKFKQHYFRNYAQKMLDESASQRYSEFNFTDSTGLEWRSFNLMHAQNWTDVVKSYQIALNALEKSFSCELQKTSEAFALDSEAIAEELQAGKTTMVKEKVILEV